ncbi:hypothetical protein [Bradyrhizobium sp. SZCCHNR1045]|uniref:hypothetical protein n=1 Tax=Bradyrhizobium sp. SZCCHNR1045 TaxID=3057353 RepID=UPI002916BE90|nr:hypothetical protein [Bradyrhizobium sp. SZCCHNR1045]
MHRGAQERPAAPGSDLYGFAVIAIETLTIDALHDLMPAEAVRTAPAAVELQQLPVIVVETETTSMIIASAQVAAVSLGENVTAADQQIPLPRLRPVPAPQPAARPEHGVMIANYCPTSSASLRRRFGYTEGYNR